MIAHAVLGASNAHRWMECAGAPRLEAAASEEIQSKDAAEGTAAHAVGEMALNSGLSPHEYVGETVATDIGEAEITPEMADAVQVYVDHCTGLRGRADVFQVEQRFSLEKLSPPTPMFGTADCVVLYEESKHLFVVDYKHGRGVVVEVEENPQLLYYALGAVLALGTRPETITVTIVQPRAEHPDGPIRSWVFGWDRLVEFKTELLAAAEAATRPDAPVGPVGDHCRWCRAKAICPAQRANALTVTQSAFDVQSPPTERLPTPMALTEDQLLAVLDKAADIEDWFKAIREHVKRLLESGEKVPGWKLVAKRATRRWADEAKAARYLTRKLGTKGAYSRKLISPHQAEVALGGGFDKKYVAGMVEAHSSGYNLARADNPKPAITPASAAQEAFAIEGRKECWSSSSAG